MSQGSFVIRIGGESGEGIVTIGEVFVRIAAFSGLEVFTFRTFPAEIMGGHVMYQARIGPERVLSQGDRMDVLVAMNREGFENHIDELRPGGCLVYDSDVFTPPESKDYLLYAVPVTRLSKQLNFMRGKNLIMVGALGQLFGLPLEKSEQMVERRLGKYKSLLSLNLDSLRLGRQYVQKHYPERPPFYLEPPEGGTEERLVMTGNQATALGALAAGCRFYAGYPITPATSIMEFLSKELPALGGTLIQAEDEIAAVTMATGASFGGVKAMTATSGPGLALMIEAIGHASMTEIPLVVVDVQRAGPSTGMPTKTAQGDLFMALYASNDEAPRFVIAPDSVGDCFYQMVNAFNLAEKYQMPVLVLTDQAMSERVETIRPIDLSRVQVIDRLKPQLSGNGKDNGYQRYALTQDGVSPMAIPGMRGGHYVAEGLEHNERGAPNYSPEMHTAMTEKRFRKVESARRELRHWNVVDEWGDPGAEIGIIGWGSTKGTVREAMARAMQEGVRAAALYPEMLLPMPDEEIRAFLSNKRAIIVPELNYRGMFGDVITHRYNVKVQHVTKYDGLPFKVQNIYDAIMEAADDLVSGVLGCWSPCGGFRSPSKEHYVHEGEGTDDVLLMRAAAGGE
jgi:2-oxoglutarate ferredoxin oxidoreductase subunit alpha